MTKQQAVDEIMDTILRCEVDGRTRGNGTRYILYTPDGHWFCEEHYLAWCAARGVDPGLPD